MFYRTVFVCLIRFVLPIFAKQDPLEITFEINRTKVSNLTKLICDHYDFDKQRKMYTVLEGQEFTIITKYNAYINHFNCSDCNNHDSFKYTNIVSKNVTTFKVEKRMGTVWNCTMLAHRDTPTIYPVVRYKEHKYSAAYCYMKIHVRQTKPPQTILVNNMVLQAVRTDLSEKDVDFIAEYQYADGDVVDVNCVNFLEPALLTMEYTMAGTKSDNSTMKELSSYNLIGFRAKLRSGHNNSYMICTNTESTDYTKVMVRFVMRTECNIVSIKINGLTLRPKIKTVENYYYDIEYKYKSHQLINVTCEVQKEGMKLVVMDLLADFVGKVSSYKKTVLEKKAVMSFYLKPTDGKKLQCSSDKINGGVTEQVGIKFTEGNFTIEQYSMHMELPSNGTVMELYNDYKLKVIYYELEDGEKLQLNCGPLSFHSPGPVLYLQLKDSEECKNRNCVVSKTHVTHKDENNETACYLKEQVDVAGPGKADKVLREIRVILRKRVLTTTTSTTTTTTTTTSTTTSTTTTTTTEAIDANTSAANINGVLSRTEAKGLMMAVIAGAVVCIIIICVSTIIVKLRKRNHSQRGPHDRNYENLQTPSATSIPAYPPQWESNYAVPVDFRADLEDTTYSVPCQEPALYSTPTPKNLRNKKQKPVDPTYAVLDLPNARGRKNTFKETDDPNYSEVYANRQEQCYAKVLPKSMRNKMAQDNNPYSYVTNEPAYANTDNPEPLYCEPAKTQGGTYANLNNAHYANSNAHKNVEPTYCEPKRMK